jgi:uncharacterized protein (TIGR00369 family)
MPQELDKNELCFGCGQDNPIGLKLNVQGDGEKTWAEFTPSELHSGFKDIVHGGLLCLLMDEVMSYLPHIQGLKAVTGKMQVRFRRLTRPGEPLKITASVLKQRSKLLEVKSAITNSRGVLIAESISHIYIMGRG